MTRKLLLSFRAAPEQARIACPRVKALFVEDSPDCALGFQRALSKFGIDLIIADSLMEARLLLARSQLVFDAVLLDLHLPDGRGEELLPDIEALSPQPGIVILSNFLDDISPDVVTYRAVLTPKTIAPARLATIVTRAAKGYAKSTLFRFAQHFGLTAKESEVLDLIATGVAPKEAALAIGCSTQAVYAHLSRIDLKTSCECYQEVVAKLFQYSCHGLGRGVSFEDE